MTQTTTTRANGVLATFYSYKGGTGRSMALANIGCLLGKSLPSNGRVLLIDWDLEAPGLHRYFPICDLPENAGRPGIIDYFSELRDKLTPELYAEISQPEGWHALEDAVPVDPYLTHNVSVGVDLIKAGREGKGYADRVASFDWAEFYRRYHLVYPAFRDMLARRYNWTLIDSRTGLTDASGVCTMLLPEKLVAVFTPNRQSVEGLINLIYKAVEYRRKSEDTRPLAVFALPSRIVTEEHKLLRAAQIAYRSEFETCFRRAYGLELPENFLAPYFDEVAIPHKGFYGFREQVAVRDDEQTTDALSINRAYERFFRRFSLLTRSWDALPTQTGAGTEGLPEEFKYDVFISYARIDNEAFGGSGPGWVARFARDLEVRLAQLLGSRPSIFFDTIEITQAGDLREQIQDALAKSAIFVPVLSPAYLNSSYSRRELDDFRHRADAFTPGHSRIVPVDFLPVPGANLLPNLLHIRAFEPRSDSFYTPDSQDLRVAIDAAARAIVSSLKELRSSALRLEGRGSASAVTVYLAETTSDLRAIRDSVRAELTQSGYTVIPQGPSPTDVKELEQTLRYDLPRARASLHLLSSDYGIVPEGETRSVIHIQCAMAAEFPLQRLIWIKDQTSFVEDRQRMWIANLTGDVDAHTEIVRGSFENYRELVLRRLSALATSTASGTKSGTNVYLVCRPEDLSEVAAVRDHLLSEGIETVLPAIEGSPAELREDHQQNLQSCDAVIIYWGKSSESWLRSQQRDLMKIRNTRDRPLVALIVIGPPTTTSKSAFRSIEFPSVILDDDPFALVGVLRQSLSGTMR